MVRTSRRALRAARAARHRTVAPEATECRRRIAAGTPNSSTERQEPGAPRSRLHVAPRGGAFSTFRPGDFHHDFERELVQGRVLEDPSIDDRDGLQKPVAMPGPPCEKKRRQIERAYAATTELLIKGSKIGHGQNVPSRPVGTMLAPRGPAAPQVHHGVVTQGVDKNGASVRPQNTRHFR